MSAEATSATGGFLLTQDFGKELLAKDKRIEELEREVEEKDRLLELAAAKLERLGCQS